MTIALFIAAALFGLSLLLFFGPQMVAYGKAGLRDALDRSEAKIIASGLVTAMALLLFAPLVGSGLISDGETGQVVATTLTGLLLG